MRRLRCGGCGAPDLVPFLDLGSSPLADRFPATADELEERYPLQVAVCHHCWLAQLQDIVPDSLLYGADYGFHTGTSPSAVTYFADYVADLDARFGLDGKFIVEVASNDGTLLAELDKRGARALGVEPAANVAAAAQDKGLDVHVVGFGDDAARAIRGEHGPVDLIVANNVAAHVADLDDFFGGMAALVAPDGAVVVEVQYLADLLAGNQFDHVYHEHRYFFSIGSLSRAMSKHGLLVRSVQRTPAQGGSIRVTATPSRADFTSMVEPRTWLYQSATYQSFQGRVNHVRDRIVEMVDEQIAAGRKVAGYAASAKSATLLNFCGLGPDRVDHIVDTTPVKIGRFTPGSKIPITSPGERPEPDVYLVLAWNYLPGILRRETAYTASGGRFLAPIPTPVLL
jgi:hypothetical protein